MAEFEHALSISSSASLPYRIVFIMTMQGVHASFGRPD